MKKKKWIGLGVTMLAATSLLTACGTSDEENEVGDAVSTEAKTEVETEGNIEEATDEVAENEVITEGTEVEVDEAEPVEEEVVAEEDLDKAPVGEPMGDDLDPDTAVSSDEAEVENTTVKE